MKINVGNTNYSGRIIWLYGRPCAGKSTIANFLSVILKAKGNSVITIDGDELRETINNDLGFSPEHRFENIRRAAELAKVLANKGFDVICSFVTPTKELRELIKHINKNMELHLIYINTSIEECIRRDVKGHYLKARNGNINDFTGIGSPFEAPIEINSAVIEAGKLTVIDAVNNCLEIIGVSYDK
jgi:adenylylsulfate kinase